MTPDTETWRDYGQGFGVDTYICQSGHVLIPEIVSKRRDGYNNNILLMLIWGICVSPVVLWLGWCHEQNSVCMPMYPLGIITLGKVIWGTSCTRT
jgi:hypothetical protein